MDSVNRTNRRVLPIIQGLWIGLHLPVMQQLSIASFVAAGHEVHVYSYCEFANCPAGAKVVDANQIIPRSEVFKNTDHDTYAAFSDLFRYRLLLLRGGWWVDFDVVCLRPFNFERSYVFAYEHDELCQEKTWTGVMRAPIGSDIMDYAWETGRRKDKSELAWDEVGPDLLHEAVGRFSLQEFVEPAITFCCLPLFNWRAVLDPRLQFVFEQGTFSIHLWHEKWRRTEYDVDVRYAPDSLYEQFKTKFLFGASVTSKRAFIIL